MNPGSFPQSESTPPFNSRLSKKARHWLRGMLLLGLAPAAFTSGLAVDSTWSSTTGGNWSDTTKWANASLADGQGAVADFSNTTLTKNAVITIDASSQTVGILDIGDKGGAYSYTIQTGTLVLDNGSSHAQINQTASSVANTISAPVVLASSVDVTNNSSYNLTISGIVSGAGGINYGGSGMLTLNGANTFTGGVVVNSGTVNISSGSGIGVGTAYLGSTSGSADATLLFTMGQVTVSNNIVVQGGGTGKAYLSFNSTASNSITLAGNITLGKDLTITGGGTASSNVLSGSISGVGTGYTLTTTLAKTLTISGNIGTGINHLVQNSNATLVLSGSSPYFTGDVSVMAGTVQVNTAYALNNTNVVNVAAGAVFQGYATGTLIPTIAGLSGSGSVLNAGSSVRSLMISGTGDYTFGGVISGSKIGLAKYGTGTQTLTGANTYTSTTSIGAGVLALDFSAEGAPLTNIINNTANSSGLIMGGGTLKITGSASATNSQQFPSLTVNSGASSIALYATGASNNLLLTTGAITRYAGSSLDFTLPTGTQSTTNGIVVTTPNLMGGVLASAATNGYAYATVGGTTWATVNASSAIVGLSTYSTGVSNYSIGNNIDVGSDTLGAGTTTANTLRFNSNTASVTIGSGNTLVVNADGILVTSAASAASINGGTLRGRSGSTSTGTELIIINNGGLTIGSVLGIGSGALTISGTGVTILTATNAYTGATYINSGVLSVSSLGLGGVSSGIGAASSGTANLVLNGGTLRYTGGTTTSDRGYTIGVNGGTFDASGSGALTLTGSCAVAKDGSYVYNPVTLTLTGTNKDNNTLSGVIYENSSTAPTTLVKSGVGTWVVSGSNSYTGSTLINGGSLVLGGSAALGNSRAVVFGGGTLSYGVSGITTDYSAAIKNSASAISIDTAGQDIAYANGLDASNTGGLTKLGLGALALNGANTYTGQTTVNGGELDVNGSITSNVVVNANAVLGGYGTVTGNVSVSAGRVNGSSSGLNVTGVTTFHGESTLAGRLVSTGGISVDSGGLLNVTGTTSSTVSVNSASLKGTGSVGNVVLASGTLNGTLTTGTISGTGLVSPGNSPGILTATSINVTAGLNFAFELQQTAPTYTNAEASGNDLLHLTGVTPFSGSLTAQNTISVYLTSGVVGSSYLGGFFVDGMSGAELQAAVENATFVYYVWDSAGTSTTVGDVYFNNSYYKAFEGSVSVAATELSNIVFSNGSYSGSELEFTVVPEPATWSMVLGGLGTLVGIQRWRRRRQG